jgi:multiple sugar transport system substrate-binding protein
MYRRFTSFVLLILVVFTLVTCTSPSQVANVSPSKTDKFRIWWNEGYYPEETGTIQQIVSDWQKESGKEANLTLYSEKDLSREVKNAIERNNPPDVLYSYTADFNLIPRLAWQNRLADVSDVILSHKDDFESQALGAVNYVNNVDKKRSYYAIPISRNSIYLHYWKDLLQQIGKDPTELPKDWQGFWQVWSESQNALRRKGKSKIYGLGLPMSATATDTFFAFEQFLNAYGGDVLNAKGALQTSQADVRQGIVAALTDYTSWFKNGFVPSQAVNWSDPDNNVSFLSKDVVMTTNPTLSIPASQKADTTLYNEKIGTVSWPNKLDGKPLVSLVAVKQAVVFANSAHKETAKSFLSYLTKPEVLDKFVKGSQGRFFPVMTNSIKQPFWSDSKDPHISIAAKQLQNTRAFNQVLNPAYTEVQAQNVWGKAIRDVVVNQSTPEQAADNAIREIEEIFNTWK